MPLGPRSQNRFVRLECRIADSAAPSTRNECNRRGQTDYCQSNVIHPLPQLKCAVLGSEADNNIGSAPRILWNMAPFLSSAALILLIASVSAKTTISFYREGSCASDVPSSGDAFETDDLASGAGICYRPPDGTIALKIDELDAGCSVSAYLDSTCSMPTSPALTLTTSPCFFLGPADVLGSFEARCSTPRDSNDATATSTPGLQSPPTSGASTLGSGLAAQTNEWKATGRWIDAVIRALVAMGAVEVVWVWGVL